MATKITGIIAALGFIASVVAANYLTARYGFVPVGFGQLAAAGTFAAGLALGLRDFIHDTLGRVGAIAAVAVGAALSLAVAPPALAAASGMAFLISELADMAVYAPLRHRARFGDRRWAAAVLASNAVGALVDTVVFLYTAFGLATVIPGLAGQMLGKGWVTIAVVATGWAGHALLRHRLNPQGA
jgi:uncharacterized PurR-regulated membrane protein YhhQ (DUF165 family)